MENNLTSSKKSEEIIGVKDNLKGLLFQLKLTMASNLARQGQYQAANEICNEILKDRGNNSRVIDLQARIFAQQGQLDNAKSLWEQAQKLDPSNIKIQKALDKTNKTNNYLSQFYSLRKIWLSIFSIIIIGSIILILYPFNNFQNKPGIEVLKSDASSLNQPVEVTDKDVINDTAYQFLLDHPDFLKPPHFTQEIEGITIEPIGNKLKLVFNDGLFNEAVNLKPEAKKSLGILCEYLENYQDQYNYTIYGCTDDLKVYSKLFRDNLDLGKSRAMFLYDYLIVNTKIRPDKILIGSYGENNVPFENSTEEHMKNRSVIIIVSHSL